MANLGVHVYEVATSVSTPRVADVGIPYVVGTAPVHAAKNPAKANTPTLVTSWDEAVEKFGFSYDDWKKYSLCEFIYSHFQLFQCQPAVLCNVLTDKMKTAAQEQTYTVTDHAAALPFDLTDVEVSANEQALTAGEDYELIYGTDTLTLELLEDGAAYGAAEVTVKGNTVDPGQVQTADVVLGVGQVDAAMNMAGVIPDLILAPGWSEDNVVAAVMAAKAGAISGLFKGKALIDVDSSEDGVTDYSGLTAYKNKNNLVDEDQILCWPMVRLGEYTFHLSTQLAGLMAQVDSGNRNIPYESPSNKNLQMDSCVLADGTEVNLTWPQVQLIAGSWGVVTAVNFMDTGWVAKGNYCACYPGNTDVKDQFIPVSRMFDFIGNTLTRTFWPKLDKPMTTPLIRSIVTTCNIWLDGLTSGGYLNGARAEVLSDENALTSLLDGIFTLHVYNTPPTPLQELDIVEEYDISYAEAAISI
jgi:hypothetical protein